MGWFITILLAAVIFQTAFSLQGDEQNVRQADHENKIQHPDQHVETVGKVKTMDELMAEHTKDAEKVHSRVKRMTKDEFETKMKDLKAKHDAAKKKMLKTSKGVCTKFYRACQKCSKCSTGNLLGTKPKRSRRSVVEQKLETDKLKARIEELNAAIAEANESCKPKQRRVKRETDYAKKFAMISKKVKGKMKAYSLTRLVCIFRLREVRKQCPKLFGRRRKRSTEEEHEVTERENEEKEKIVEEGKEAEVDLLKETIKELEKQLGETKAACMNNVGEKAAPAPPAEEKKQDLEF